MRLSEYEMYKLRKKMKKNHTWEPSEVMIRRELAEKGRGRDNYLKAKAEAEKNGKPLLDMDVAPEKPSLTLTIKTEAPKAEPAPAPVASRGPPPSMTDNKASLADQASKFADRDEEESSEDEASSFEEVAKPVERPSVTAARQEIKTAGAPVSKEPEKPIPSPALASAPVKATPPPAAQPTPTPAAEPSRPATAAGAAAGLKDFLTDIKATLERQNQVMSDQSDQIALLMRDVSTLKTRVGSQNSDREKDERIRQLELELEEARS